MTGLIKFEFEGKPLRTAGTPEDPLFDAGDLCELLGFANPHQAVATHVPEDDLQKLEVVDSLGRRQARNYVKEPGMWRLVLRANTEFARAVQDWVVREVLPALRKTGRYEVPRQQPALPAANITTIRAIRYLTRSIAKDHGVASDLAEAAALEMVRRTTGLDVEPARKLIPGRATPPEWLNPTQIGETLGLSARQVNKDLELAGLQERVGSEWRLTEAGKHYAEAKPYERNGHTGFQIAWRPLVIAVLEAATAPKPEGEAQ